LEDQFYFGTDDRVLNRAFGRGFSEAALSLSRAEPGAEDDAIREAIGS